MGIHRCCAITTLSLCSFSSRSGAEDTADLATISAAIDACTEQFTAAHVSGDLELLDSMFTASARVYAPNADVVVGRQEISRINAGYLSYGIAAFREESTSR